MRRVLLGTMLSFVLAAAPARTGNNSPLPRSSGQGETQPVKVPFDLLVTKHMVIQVKINGKRVELDEIEARLRAESCQPLQFLSSQIGHIPSMDNELAASANSLARNRRLFLSRS